MFEIKKFYAYYSGVYLLAFFCHDCSEIVFHIDRIMKLKVLSTFYSTSKYVRRTSTMVYHRAGF